MIRELLRYFRTVSETDRQRYDHRILVLEREAESLKKSVRIVRDAYEKEWHANHALRGQVGQLQTELAKFRHDARWGR